MKLKTIIQYTLLSLRKLYTSLIKPNLKLPECELDANKASDIIYNALMDDKPCMITRFGAVEISALRNYIGVINKKNRNIWKFIIGKEPEWWWNDGIRFAMTNNAGFFPTTNENMLRFGDLMIDCIKSIDVLGSWQPDEEKFTNYFPTAKLINFVFLDPYWSDEPWTSALKDKKVLVVHPFAELIDYQYNTKREQLFENKKILPLFNLKTIKAVQSIGGNDSYENWFDALEYMKEEINKQDYDICLIGAGAYGLPLASHVKRMGKKAVHIGGTLQLLFGIIGKRWENPNYAFKELGKPGLYLKLINDKWIRVSKDFKPDNFKNVENGCYW